MNRNSKLLFLFCVYHLTVQCQGFPQYDGGDNNGNNNNNNNNEPDVPDEDAATTPAVPATTLTPAQVIGQINQTFGLVGGILNAVFCNQWFGIRLCPSGTQIYGPVATAPQSTGITPVAPVPPNVANSVQKS